MDKKIIAVFGGSFNPPINSHLNLAKQIIEKCKDIEKLFFMPVSTKYKKARLVDDMYRYNMLKLICEDEEKIEVSDIELKQERQLYTIETLDLLKEQYGEEYEIWLVMGTDNLKELETWREPERLLREYKILVLDRDDDDINEIIEGSMLLKNNKNSIIEVGDIDRIKLSSTIIRDKIKNNEDVKKYVPKKVLEYIKQNNLYKD